MRARDAGALLLLERLLLERHLLAVTLDRVRRRRGEDGLAVDVLDLVRRALAADLGARVRHELVALAGLRRAH